MFLSCLDLAPDPYNRGVQLWLSNPYRIHQRLCLAFDNPGRLLFRLEERPRLRIIVQSPTFPDWNRAFADFPAVLDGPAHCKEFAPELATGQILRFLLRANPTVKREGKRHGLFKEPDQRAWLERKGRDGGFAPLTFEVRGATSQTSMKGPQRAGGLQSHFLVEFEGTLGITDSTRFATCLEQGIGSGKGLGFGLLSIAPQRYRTRLVGES